MQGSTLAAAATRVFFEHERGKIDSITQFAELHEAERTTAMSWVDKVQGLIPVESSDEDGQVISTVYARNADPEGPMHGFGYSWIIDQLGEEEFGKLELPGYEGERGAGGLYTYEALNLVDGKRTVSEIRDWLTAELGPVPVEYVVEYLQAIESAGAIQALD